MVDYGKTRSTVKPPEIEITETKVFIASEITTVTEDGADEQQGFTGYEYNLAEYGKDEYIKLQAEKSKTLETELTETQEAIAEVYELMN